MARKLQYYEQEVEQIKSPALNLRIRVKNEFDRLLRARAKAPSRLPSDNDLFIPFVDAFVYCTFAAPLVSVIKEIGDDICNRVFHFEQSEKTKINKEHLYYAMAAISIQQNDEVNAMIYWEMANVEFTETNGVSPASNAVVSLFEERFTQVYNPIVSAYNDNSFVKQFKGKYPFILEFDDLLIALPQIDQLHFISNAIRNRKIQGWLRQHSDIKIVKMFCQELVNSLSIQAESLLKENPRVTEKQFGGILRKNLPTISPVLHAILDNRKNGIFKRYPIKDIPGFNSHFRSFIADIESSSSADEFRATILHFVNVLRNQVLHQFDDSITYYQNKDDFEKVVGILFVAFSIILSL